MTDNFREIFRTEAMELLLELESAMMDLEETPDNEDLIDRVFRAMHTIKGTGAMFGFAEISALAHEAETAFDEVRRGNIPVTRDLVDLMLSTCDQIRKMVDDPNPDLSIKMKLVEKFRDWPCPIRKRTPDRTRPIPAGSPRRTVRISGGSGLSLGRAYLPRVSILWPCWMNWPAWGTTKYRL